LDHELDWTTNWRSSPINLDQNADGGLFACLRDPPGVLWQCRRRAEAGYAATAGRGVPLERRAENDQHQPALRDLAFVDQALAESLVHVRDRSKKGPQITLSLMILGIFVADLDEQGVSFQHLEALRLDAPAPPPLCDSF
jgi:hypothetical protein